VGAGAAVDYLASLAREAGSGRRQALETGFEELHRRGKELFRQLWEGLGDIKSVRRFGLPPDEPRTPTLALRVDGKSSDDVAVALAQRGLFVSHGDFYAATVIERLGVGADGVVRIGCSAYTTADEIERAVDAIKQIAG
jgi:selenocysteine lyase/cysteine desulfurase